MGQQQRGITLIELVFATALSLVIMLVLFAAYSVGVRTFDQEMDRFDVFWDSHAAVNQMVSEIQRCLDIISNEPDSISFWLDDANDNGSMEADEVVSYSLSGSTLTRGQGGTLKPLAKNVSVLGLEYDNIGYPTLVTITLTMLKGQSMVTIESKADVRSR